jgi:hypothetical protein
MWILGKIRLTIKTSFGDISIEGESIRDIRNSLLDVGFSKTSIDKTLETIKHRLEEPVPSKVMSVAPSKPEAAGVIEYGTDGKPHIIVSPDALTGKEVIGLVLYAKSPNPVSMSELRSLVSDNWKSVSLPTISAYLSYMRAFIIKEGTRGSFTYRLSGSGRSWIENEVFPKLKSKESG